MVIDSSVLISILLGGPEAGRFAGLIEADPVRLVSAFSLLETAIVIESKKGEAGGREFDLLALKAGLETVALDREQAGLARQAWKRYGKGRHKAGLNIGDCCSYALSRQSGEPLLFKGTDFSRTDIVVVE